MGCGGSSMDIYEPSKFRDKTLLWLIGGGPGAPKPQVAQFLIDRFKFKLISAFDLVRFEENTGSPEAVEIKKCIQQKKQFSSDLIIRILKRIFALYGPRKYLIEGFPRNEADLSALTDLCKKYERVELLGYINLSLTEEQMKESGMRALKEMKKDQSEQNIEKEVRARIEEYRSKMRPVHEFYQSNNTFINLDYNNDVYQLNLKLEEELSKQDLSPVRMVPVHFLQGNDSKEIASFANKLAKKFGLFAWSIQEILAEASTKPDLKKQAEKPIDEVDEKFLANLIGRKIQKNNFKGQYLFWGYPRKEEDLKAIRVIFLRELQFSTFCCCLHTPTTQNEQTQFQKLYDYFKDYEKIPSLMVNAGDTAFSQIQSFVSKTAISAKGSGKLVVIPSLGNEGSESLFPKMTQQCEYVEFKQLLKKEVEKQTLYSELIQSNQNLDRPLPPPLASIIVFAALREYQQKQQSNNSGLERPFIVKGYPQNMEQLKSLHSKCPDLKLLASVVFDYSDKGSKEKVAGYTEMVKVLEQTCDTFQRFSQKTPSEEYKSLCAKLTSL